MVDVLSSEQYRHVQKYIEEHDAVYEYPFEIEGRPSPVQPVHRLPLNVLRFNVQNGRYVAERLALERQLGTALDRLNVHHQEQIRRMLKEENPSRWNDLKSDLREHGQQTPAIATAEGDVINGNRRMALLLELHGETHQPKFETMDTIVLPPSINEKALWRIEAGIQLSQQAQLDYGPINNLLKLREGIDAGLSVDDMSAVLLGMKASDIEDRLDRLRLIDMYLSYHGIENEYVYAQQQGLHEYFINLQNAIRAWKKEKLSEAVISKRIQNAFNVMQMVGTPGIKFSQNEFRKIREIYQDADARQSLEKGVGHAISENTQAKEEQLQAIKNAWDDARETVRIKQDRNQPVRNVQYALDRLRAVDADADSFTDERVIQRLYSIKELVAVLIDKYTENV